jgi:tRNA-2-methylthio-N6-dimethylallyladenosine synthase
VLGVGGCVAQQEGDALLRRFAHLDFAFGPQSLRLVPAMVEAALAGQRSLRTEEDRSPARFELPGWHPEWTSRSPGRSFVTVMEGCDLFCSFCIVPLTRGREVSRAGAEVVAEVEELARRGVREVVLLGQTVNAWGRHARRRGAAADAPAGFAALLARLAEVPGIVRLRYTSPHPAFFDEALVRAHGELGALCPHVHLPLQSGSDAVLARMRRRHDRDEYRRLVDRLRQARPDLALTTDLIVGFPGESDADFHDTLELVREVGFVDSFSFKYSPRPGTAAAGLQDAVPAARAQARLEELQALQRELTLAAHRGRVGQEAEVLVEGPSRKGGSQLQGRDPWHRWVHLDAGQWEGAARPGALLRASIREATPHSLIGVPPEGLRVAGGSAPGGRGILVRDELKVAGSIADETRRTPATA